MNKIIISIMFVFLLVGTVSAFEFDNVVNYEKSNQVARIDNAFNLPFIGDTLARVTLESQVVGEVKGVFPGKNRRVMEFTIENFAEDYGGWMDGLEFIDQKTGKEIDREYHWVYVESITEREIEKKENYDCSADKDERLIVDCKTRIYETVYEYTNNWADFDETVKLPKGNITLGLVTDVLPGDHIDGIPILFGKKIVKWAAWADSLEDGIIAWYSFNSTNITGDFILDEVNGTNNGTFENNNQFDWVQGIAGNGTSLNNESGEIITLANTTLLQDAFGGSSGESWSYSFWLNYSNLTSFGGYNCVLSQGFQSSGLVGTFCVGFGPGGNFQFSSYGSTNSLGVQQFWPDVNLSIDNNFTHFVLVASGDGSVIKASGLDLYVNNQKMVKGTLVEDTRDATFNPTSGPAIGKNTAPGSGYNGTIDEVGIWRRNLTLSEIENLYNNGTSNTFPGTIFKGTSLIVRLVSPANSFVSNNQFINFSGNFSANNANLTNSTLYVWNPDNSLLGTNTTDITGIFNTTNLSMAGIVFGSGYQWNYEVCINDSLGVSFCGFSAQNRTFSFQLVTENNVTWNGSSVESAREHFTLNITSPVEPTEIFLNYNGTRHVTTFVNVTGDDWIAQAELDISLNSFNVQHNNSFFFEISFSGAFENTTMYNQTVNPLNLTICDTTNINPYVNFSFKNETVAQESVNATISSVWSFWIADKTINRTLSFSTSVENKSYAFCFDQPDRTIAVDLGMNYNNAESQQRSFSFSSQSLSNNTLNQTLYLLPTSQGIFNPFQTVNTVGDPVILVGVSITRVISGETVTVATGTTDGSGFATFFLNPDATHTGVFTKTGLPPVTLVFTPTTDLRSIIMGGSTTAGNTTTIVQGTVYFITPSNGSLQNETDYTFGFDVSSNQTITFISMNITLENGTQVVYQENSGQGFISEVFNTGNNTRLIGKYLMQTSTELISVTKIWTVGNFYAGSYSIFRQGVLYLEYGFSDFIRLLIVMISIMSIIIFLSAGEITDTSESKVVVGVLMLWIFSVIGWLNTGLIVNSDTENITRLGRLSSQYGIAIICTIPSFFFIFRRIFIRRI